MESLGVTGGLSGAVIWRVSVAGNQLCLRRWPQVHPSLSGLLAIHGLLNHVVTAGFDLVPIPLETRYGESYFDHEDHLWELTPWLPGEASLAREPTASKLTAAMETLAHFHQTAASYQSGNVTSRAPAPGLQQRLAMLRNLQQGELQQLWLATRTAEPSDLRELAFELLESLGHCLQRALSRLERLASVPLPLQWCLRDVRHDHLLFTKDDLTGEQRVSGLLDFGAAAIDSVAGDLARLLGSIVNDHAESWQAGIEAYTKQRPLSPAELQAISAFDEGGVLCSATNWVRWIFVEGRHFPQIHALHAQLTWLRNRLQTLATPPAPSIAEPPIAGPTWGRTANSNPQQAHDSPWTHT